MTGRMRAQLDAEFLRRHHAQRSAQAADVRRAGRQVERAVLVQRQRDGGVTADVEPEAGSDAAALVGAERCFPVIALFGSFESLDHADRAEAWAVSGLCAFLGGVLEAELDRIDVERLGHLVHDAFDRDTRKSVLQVHGRLQPSDDWRRRRSR